MDYFTKKTPKKITLDDGSEHYIKKLSVDEVKTISRKYSTTENAVEGLAYAVCKAVVDESGCRKFTDDYLPKLMNEDFDLLSQLAGEITDYGMPPKTPDQKKV